MKMDREQTTIRLPADLKEQIQRQAEDEGQSFNNFVAIIFRRWVRDYQARLGRFPFHNRPPLS